VALNPRGDLRRRGRGTPGGGHCVSPGGEAENSKNETNLSRNETLRVADHKSLKSLRALNQQFRGIVCFQSLNPVFVSRSRRVHSLIRKSPSPAGATRLFERAQRSRWRPRSGAALSGPWVTVGHWASALTTWALYPSLWKCRFFFSYFYFSRTAQPDPRDFSSFWEVQARSSENPFKTN
jgi:hypothetical protein